MWCLKGSASAVRLQVKSGAQLEVGAAEDPNLAQLRKSNPQMEVWKGEKGEWWGRVTVKNSCESDQKSSVKYDIHD